MFCVLDIESSGGAFGKEAIIEIALFKYDGEEIVDQLISLVHPHKEIQHFVSKMTGITSKMVLRAPRFHEIAKRIVEITEGSILVGHNVEFDYRMLRQEFALLGYPFELETLDTIETARELIPGLPAYGLHKLCKEVGIDHKENHRAEGDARATLDLFKMLREKDNEKGISILGQSITQNSHLKDKINDLLRSVKQNKGIFYLHNLEGKLLYLNASNNIKGSLNKLFLGDDASSKKLVDQTHSVRVEGVGSWILSRIKKQNELEVAHPSFNRVGSLHYEQALLVDNRKDLPKITQRAVSKLGAKKPLTLVPSQRLADRTMSMFARVFPTAEARREVISLVQNFPEKGVFETRGRVKTERCALVVENYQLIGYYYFNLNDQIARIEQLEKTLTPVNSCQAFTDLVKVGLLSGEVKRARSFA